MPGIDYTLGMKTAGFDTGVKGALSKLGGISAKVAAVTAAAGLAAGVGVAAIIKKSIGKAAEMESLETAFIPLLGSVKAARERIAELADFAADTPFEMPEVVAASKTLETLTRGALSTGRGLTLVGDVASTTKAPIGELAVTIGRLYDGLDSGRPVGEALARLQELGAISGETRARIEALQAEGRKGAEVWGVAEAALGRFAGAMGLQSQTWEGKMSNLRDTVSRVMAEFGKPIMDSLKPFLDGAIVRLESLKDSARRVGEALGESIGIVRAAFENGQVFEVATGALKVGFLEAVNTLHKGIQAVAGVFMESFAGTHLINIFVNLARIFGNELKEQVFAVLNKLPDWMGGGKYDNDIGWAEFNQDQATRRLKLNAGDFAHEISSGGLKNDFNRFYSDSGDLPALVAERKNWEGLIGPIRAQAAADAEARRRLAEENANRIAAGAARPSGGEPAETAPRDSGVRDGLPTADRLARIGGYVGGSAAGLQRKAAEATAKWTEQSARALQTLVQRGSVRQAAVF